MKLPTKSVQDGHSDNFAIVFAAMGVSKTHPMTSSASLSSPCLNVFVKGCTIQSQGSLEDFEKKWLVNNCGMEVNCVSDYLEK